MKAATLDPRLDDRLADAERRFTGVQEALGSPGVLSSPDMLRELGQERAYLEPIVTAGQALRDALGEHADAVELIEESVDPEMKAMAEEEAESLAGQIETLSVRLKELLIPPEQPLLPLSQGLLPQKQPLPLPGQPQLEPEL